MAAKRKGAYKPVTAATVEIEKGAFLRPQHKHPDSPPGLRIYRVLLVLNYHLRQVPGFQPGLRPTPRTHPIRLLAAFMIPQIKCLCKECLSSRTKRAYYYIQFGTLGFEPKKCFHKAVFPDLNYIPLHLYYRLTTFASTILLP